MSDTVFKEPIPKPEPLKSPANQAVPSGIGGWLIFVAIGACLMPLLFLYQTANASEPLERAILGAFLIFSLVILYAFFAKRRYFPKFMIAMHALFTLALLLGSLAEPTQENIRDLTQAAVSSAIWIPYLLNSKRVKATFASAAAGQASTPPFAGFKTARLAWWAAAAGTAINIATAVYTLVIDPSQGSFVVGTGLFSVAMLSLGLAVRRGDRLAAWSLFAVWAVNVCWGLYFNHLSFIAQLPLLIPSLIAADNLPSRPEESRMVWATLLYELAFAQALLTAFIVVAATIGGPEVVGQDLSSRVSYGNLTDVALLAALGFGALRRKRWAGWSLVIYQAGNSIFKLFADPSANMMIPLGMTLMYAMGAYHLARLHNTAHPAAPACL